MPLTYGFFDSADHDRLYDADDIGGILEGVITDGIVNHFGQKFLVQQVSGTPLTVSVGTGKAWFLRTWIRLTGDAVQLTAEPNTTGSERIDTVVISIDKRRSFRENKFEIVKGTTSRPVLPDSGYPRYYPLADIKISATGNVITEIVDRRSEIYAASMVDGPRFYPVGAIYISVDNTEPSALFGGTWERIAGRFLIGCGMGTGILNGETGGSWTHTITNNELPTHNHYLTNVGTTGANANIGFRRQVDGEYPVYTTMGWPQPAEEYTDQHLQNHLPASWNYPYGYQGSQTSSKSPEIGPSANCTSEVELHQEAHSHYVNGTTDLTGNGNPIEIKPPYLGVYMWKRIA